MTRSGLLFGTALALIITAAAAEDENSANHMLPGCRGFIDKSSSLDMYDMALCAGILDGIVFMVGRSGLRHRRRVASYVDCHVYPIFGLYWPPF
jgi:hypothetical protein